MSPLVYYIDQKLYIYVLYIFLCMKQCESVVSENMSEENIDIKFSRVRNMIEEGVSEEWLPKRNIMYLNDIQDISTRQGRHRDAGNHINTIMHYVRENEHKASTEAYTRELLVELGELQTELHNMD